MNPINKIYKHYKGKYYRVLYHAKHTETEQKFVVYQQLYAKNYPLGFVWVRPFDLFYGKVKNDVQRFNLIKDYPTHIRKVLRKLEYFNI